MSASDEKLIKDMPSEAYKKLVMLLQPLSATGRDYKSLADRMGYSNQYIQFLQSTKDPVLTLIKEYQQGDKRISELISLLRDMKRYDVVEELQPYIGKCVDSEIHTIYPLLFMLWSTFRYKRWYYF